MWLVKKSAGDHCKMQDAMQNISLNFNISISRMQKSVICVKTLTLFPSYLKYLDTHILQNNELYVKTFYIDVTRPFCNGTECQTY